MSALRAPFPWFGGKSRAAPLIWRAFGNVPNYVEPFAGSLAVLLARPHEPKTETVNDLDCYVANFWRAVSADVESIIEHADWPVNEADLSSRHQWLVDQAPFRERMKVDPAYYDARIAGWWVWGLCQWIGHGWCELRGDGRPPATPDLGDAGMGVHRQLPHLGDAGMGVHRQLPHLGDAGMGVELRALCARLRRVRVACGDWSRVVTESVTTRHGLTGVLLDPPYTEGAMDYAAGGVGSDLAAQVRDWAIANGDNPSLRIALCGHEGEHAMPRSWRCVPWKPRKGYQGKDNDSASRERVWFSPHCLEAVPQRSLFGTEAA